MNTIELINKYKNEKLEEDVEDHINDGLPLYSMWNDTRHFVNTFEEHTEIFFVLFKEMLRRGHLKLQKDGVLIEHTPEEWEAIFRAVWPTKIGDKWINVPTDYFRFDEDSIGIWLTVDAPAYAVWVDPDDGSLYWAG